MQKRNGFSRWELLSLGAVSGIVGALLLPVLAQTGARPTSAQRADSCISNLKQISLGFLQYVQDYDERMPIAAFEPSGNSYGWAVVIQPYIRNTRLYQCPSERNRRQDNVRAPGYSDYWYNRNQSGISIQLMQAPLLNLMLGDGDGGAPNSTARYNLNALPKSWLQTPNSPARRHMNQGCYAFADGHVERLNAKEVGGKAATFMLR